LSELLSTLPGVSQVRLPSASSACCDRPKEQVSHLLTVTKRLVALEISRPRTHPRRRELPHPTKHRIQQNPPSPIPTNHLTRPPSGREHHDVDVENPQSRSHVTGAQMVPSSWRTAPTPSRQTDPSTVLASSQARAPRSGKPLVIRQKQVCSSTPRFTSQMVEMRLINRRSVVPVQPANHRRGRRRARASTPETVRVKVV
jgi:hypothetical protein